MMKFLIIFAVCAKILQSNRVETCESGEVILKSEENNLGKQFVEEYASKRNTLLNAMTVNWFYHLKDMHDLDTYNLCDCIVGKIRPNISEIVIGMGASTTKELGIDLSEMNIKSDIPAVSCIVSDTNIILIEGYKNNGLKKAYDIYAIQKKTNGTVEYIDFLALVRSVNFKIMTYEHVFNG